LSLSPRTNSSAKSVKGTRSIPVATSPLGSKSLNERYGLVTSTSRAEQAKVCVLDYRQPRRAVPVDGGWTWKYHACAMWGRITRIVGLVLLAVIMASVVSPCFDLHATALRTHKRAIIQFSLAVPFFWPRTLPASPTFLTMPRTPQWHQAFDIVVRDCARLC
jgi:hypothetical protein